MDINVEGGYFERDNIRIYSADGYSLVNGYSDIIYTTLSTDVEDKKINIGKMFDFLVHLNSRLIGEKISDIYDYGDGFMPGTSNVYFDFQSNNVNPCEIPNGYIFINIDNGILEYDRLLVNYLDLNEIDLLMDRYTHVFEKRYKLDLTFVD